MASHAPFAAWNRVVNPPVRAILRSRAHRLVSGSLALITVTGRRSGRAYTIPVTYRHEADRVEIVVGWPERKHWWRNLTGAGAPVELMLTGERFAGHAVARGDELSGVTVEVELRGRT